MKVKELYSNPKYKGYEIMIFGRPLSQRTTPFSFLKSDWMDWEVKEMKKENIHFNQFDFRSFKTKGKKIPMKGTIYVYAQKEDFDYYERLGE